MKTFISYVVVAILGFSMAFFIPGIFQKNTSAYDMSQVQNPPADTQTATGYSSYYEQLNDYQKGIYDALLQPISKGEKEIVLQNVNLTDFLNNCNAAATALQYDHPEYFWFTGGYSYVTSRALFAEEGEIVYQPIYYEYTGALFNFAKKSEELMAKVQQVADLARAHSSVPDEQILFVHDYLIKNARYDHDAVKEYYKSSHNPSCEYIFSAYGCLIDGKTVCSGYAKAFMLVLRNLGYDCSYVTGEAGEPHGWNCVYLDGKGYFVDITWNDHDLETEVPMYDYAFVRNEELARTHIIDMEFEPPVCNATEYNYHIRRNYYTETYDYETASAILSAQSGGDAAYIRFGSNEELGKAYTQLIQNRNYLTIPGLAPFKNAYYSEGAHTLTLIK